MNSAMNCEDATVRMWFENLAAMDQNERRTLNVLQTEWHIHGGLRLEIADRLVPYLGYWGNDDVCFGQWLGELSRAAFALGLPNGRHVFDEGEQGQPAFVFERDADRGFFSIAPSQISDAEGDPDWQRIEFSPVEFVLAFARLRADFEAELCRASPINAEAWLDQIDWGTNDSM